MPHIAIHCLGDSITHAEGLPECGRWTGLLQRLLDEMAADRYAVYNHGVGGNTSAMGMDRLRDTHIGADFTIIEFGLNDCSCNSYSVKNRVSIGEYRDNIQAIAEIVGKRGGQAILVANHLPIYVNEARQADGQLYSEKILAYNAVLRDIAAAQALPLIDAEAHFAAAEQVKCDLRADGLHLNIAGNRVYAAMVFRALQQLLA